MLLPFVTTLQDVGFSGMLLSFVTTLQALWRTKSRTFSPRGEKTNNGNKKRLEK
jgi:hypothetical protein